MREFVGGAVALAHGFGWWRRHPRVMALGLVPAFVVAVLFGAALVVLATHIPAIADALTPFADGWPSVWATTVRIGAGAAVLGAALVLTAVSFTAVTLIVGEPFYDRIWRSVEADAGGIPDSPYRFRDAVSDVVSLVARGIVVAIVAALVGLIPVVGSVAGAVVGVILTGRLLAEELTSRALTARGLDRAARRRALKGHRRRALGFGVATQLCFLVPLGAVAVMPAAVAGSTLLVQRALSPGERPAHVERTLPADRS